MAILNAIAGQTNFMSASSWYEAAAPSTGDMLMINEGYQQYTNLTGLPDNLEIIVGPNFNGSLDGIAGATNIAQLDMAAGSGAYVKVACPVTNYIAKAGAGKLAVSGATLPVLYAFNTSRIQVLEACDLSSVFLFNASDILIESHASAILDVARMENAHVVLRRNLDQGVMAGRSRLRMENCAVNDGAGTALLEVLDPQCTLEIVNRAAATHNEVRGYAGSMSIAESAGTQTFTKLLESPLFNFARRNLKGTAAVVTTPTIIGAAGLASYTAAKNK